MVKDVGELVERSGSQGADPMNHVLVIAEHDGRRLERRHGPLRAVRAACRAPKITVLVFGHEVAAVADEAAQLAGVARVRVADAPGFEHPLAAVLAPAAAAAIAR